ncbi:MAG: carbohydrate ABC transporter permease [Treponema sp.]|jgi:putative aldouronate transport system permease protein|nr:carbohydrate ABC transporter permease [Treponema sp.]
MRISEGISRFVLGSILIFAALITLYPFLYVFSMSISAPEHVIARDVYFWPKGFGLDGYRLALENPTIWRSYYNTVWYTLIGTCVNVVMTILAAYPLSRDNFVLRRPVSIMITITMFLSGGMIPFFIIVSRMGLYNTRLAMILPFAVSAWNILIARTFYSQISESLAEAAKIDGANEFQILVRIMIPLSKAIMAVLALFYAVGYWNSYFWALVFLRDPDLQPLQIYLYKILIQLQQDTMGGMQINIVRAAATEQLKYAAIMITILPILAVYPFLQKHFVKGVMIGAIKE